MSIAGNFLASSEIQNFVEEEFGQVDLGDVRRNRRLQKVVAQLSADPCRSIPLACSSWSETKGAYRLFANEKVTHKNVLQPHLESTARKIDQEQKCLVISDTTFINLTHHPATKGIGNIGSRKWPNQLRGTLVHSTLAVNPNDGQLLGILDQQILIRSDYQNPEETIAQRRGRKRESEKWINSVKASCASVSNPNNLIFVFDREGDVFEVFEELKTHSASYVIRGNYDRRVLSSNDKRAYLFTEIKKKPIGLNHEVAIPAGGGRRARTAQVSLRWCDFEVLPPKARDRKGSPQKLNLVWIVEDNPPPDVNPIEWYLLTNLEIQNESSVLKVLEYYCARWQIEEWHKGIKTGCLFESRQLETWNRMAVLLAIFSVIAWRLLAMRAVARSPMTRLPDDLLSETQIQLLHHLEPALLDCGNARSYLRTIAKLGGFLARNRDGDPGWITLWRGFARLRDLEIGFQLANGPSRYG
jgi:hypothetical protein